AADLIPYYEAFVSATDHQPGNTDPGFSSFAWLVQVMSGLTPADIVRSSEKAYARGIGKADSSDRGLGETRVNGYRRPFFQPEMVDLVGALLRNGYDVYVVSASNVWTVRWMVTKQLNALMRAEDAETPLVPADHVIGVSVLLRDTRTGRLYKDQLLVKENKAYADLEAGELANYKLTTRIAPPLSGYFGKVANIMKHVSLERPFLIAGDSPNDHPMLAWAENRLWMARLEKRAYQEKTAALMGTSLPGRWFVQPVLYKASPGFVPCRSDLERRLRAAPPAFNAADESARVLEGSGRLKGF
ncbi:MAG: HAD family hydrolase, partial [Planctomycetota bacterium]